MQSLAVLRSSPAASHSIPTACDSLLRIKRRMPISMSANETLPPVHLAAGTTDSSSRVGL